MATRPGGAPHRAAGASQRPYRGQAVTSADGGRPGRHREILGLASPPDGPPAFGERTAEGDDLPGRRLWPPRDLRHGAGAGRPLGRPPSRSPPPYAGGGGIGGLSPGMEYDRAGDAVSVANTKSPRRERRHVAAVGDERDVGPSRGRPRDPASPAAPVVRVHRERGVTKFAQRLEDGAVIESVVIPMRVKEAGRLRHTLCVSTQVGCRMRCAFCATGKMGFVRDLSSEEILGQLAAAETLGVRPTHLVFMGMGEPLDNYDNWERAVRRLIESRAVRGRPPRAWSTRQMILSTCGLVPGIDRLAAQGWRGLVLAVSLNAPNDSIRSQLMPVNRRWPMAKLRAALLRYPLRGGVFLAEYVLFRGINDRREHAVELAHWLRPFRACVNLISWNPAGQGEFESPTAAEVERFKRWLNAEGQYARRREPKGRRIAAACGQLAGAAADRRVPGHAVPTNRDELPTPHGA